MTEKRRARKQLVMIALWMILIVLAAGGAALAWFSFNNSTNVEPMGSTVSDGEMNLLISNSRRGEFDTSCPLSYNKELDTLSPVSTGNLSRFYRSIMQDADGLSVQYADDTGNVNTKAIHGFLYLKSDGDCDVYLDRSRMKISGDAQILSAGRLGMRVSTRAGEGVRIFRLDSMGNTSGAASRRTVPGSSLVVASISGDGKASYVSDPSTGFEGYYAGGDAARPRAGRNKICSMKANEIAVVEYWLYLEGCDDNCFNPVQNRNITLQFGFAGVGKGERP